MSKRARPAPTKRSRDSAAHDLGHRIKAMIGINAHIDVVIPGSIERSMGKAVRIRDLRPKVSGSSSRARPRATVLPIDHCRRGCVDGREEEENQKPGKAQAPPERRNTKAKAKSVPKRAASESESRGGSQEAGSDACGRRQAESDGNRSRKSHRHQLRNPLPPRRHSRPRASCVPDCKSDRMRSRSVW